MEGNFAVIQLDRATNGSSEKKPFLLESVNLLRFKPTPLSDSITTNDE